MKLSLRSPWAAAFVATIFFGATQHVSAQAYRASILGAPDGGFAIAFGISGANIVGYAGSLTSPTQAIVWNTASGTITGLGAGPGSFSLAAGASPDTQVGHYSIELPNHAALWHGTAGSLVDLHPAGFDTSYAYAVSGNNQVGEGRIGSTGNNDTRHALLWHGSAASAVDLTPAGYVGSTALAVEGNTIGGSAFFFSGSRAGLWQGDAHTFITLPATGFVDSYVSGLWQSTEVGNGTTASGIQHALLWHGTAGSAIDLNPGPTYKISTAFDVAGNFEVGSATGSLTGNREHAFLWQGTAASGVDLHSLLTGFGATFYASAAYGVDENGVIVGTATDFDGRNYAVAWTPVPEPASCALLGFAALGFLSRRRR